MNNERLELNKNFAQMLKGGVIMDVSIADAEETGTSAVMVLESDTGRYKSCKRSI